MMFGMSIPLLCLLAAFENAVATGCTRDADGKANCENPDQTALLQGRVRVASQDDLVAEPFYYGPQESSKSLLDYFKHWSKGSIESHLSRIIPPQEDVSEWMSALEVETSALSVAEAGALLSLEMIRGCPGKAPTPAFTDPAGEFVQTDLNPEYALVQNAEFKVVHSETPDADGVRHVLLQDRMGSLQYMASHQLATGEHQALVTDPPICSKIGSLEVLLEVGGEPEPIRSADPVNPSDDVLKPISKNDPVEADHKGSGGAGMLLTTDPLVTDCKVLFENTYSENCGGKKVSVKVNAANRVVINGLSVHMRVSVCNSAGDCQPHHPECTYETSTDHTDASFFWKVQLRMRPRVSKRH
jgi:hypothetical protein